MKVFIYLIGDALERLAKDSQTYLYPWDFNIRLENGPNVQEDVSYNKPPADGQLVGEGSVTFPDRTKATEAAIEALNIQIAKVRAEAHTHVTELQNRKQNLLALNYDRDLDDVAKNLEAN